MSSNSLHSLELLEEINNYPDSTPNVENVLTYYLVSAKNNKSQNRVASHNEGWILEELSNTVIERIKEKGIITDDNDLLISLIKVLLRATNSLRATDNFTSTSKTPFCTATNFQNCALSATSSVHT